MYVHICTNTHTHVCTHTHTHIQYLLYVCYLFCTCPPAQRPLYHFNHHSGPVLCMERSPFFKDIVLSVGGWSFSLWKEGCEVPMFVFAYVCTYEHIRMYVCMYVRTYVCTYVRTYIQLNLDSKYPQGKAK